MNPTILRAWTAPALLLAVAGMAGCAGSAARSQPAASTEASTPAIPPASGMASGGECDASGLQGSIGRKLDNSLASDLQQQSGSSTTRVLRPGEVVTMEYNPQRLNVLIDGKETITAIRCG